MKKEHAREREEEGEDVFEEDAKYELLNDLQLQFLPNPNVTICFPLPPTAAAAARLPFHPPPSKGNLAKPPERRMSRSFDERNSRDILARPVHPLSAVSAPVVEREVGAEE